MSDLVTCPSCARTLHVADALRGRALRCPACSATFDAPAAEDLSAHDEPCPACGATIPARLFRCPDCGGARPAEDERPWEDDRSVRRDWESHRGPTILTLGILSIVFSLLALPCCSVFGVVVEVITLGMGISALVMGRRDLKKMRTREMDPRGLGNTQAGFVCGIVGTVLSVLISLLLVLGAAAMMVMMGGVMQQAQVAQQQAQQAKQARPVQMAPPPPQVVPMRELLPMPKEEPLP